MAQPQGVLETETAMRVAMMIRRAKYELEVTPRGQGADLAASRDGTVWATFHVEYDRKRPLDLQVGATVWGGARTSLGTPIPLDVAPTGALDAFVDDRLRLACKRGRQDNPDHCLACPDPTHRV